MRYIILTVCALAFTISSYGQKKKTKSDNVLTAEEKKQGWVLLFDGKSTANFRGVYKDKFPENGWEVKDGMLYHIKCTGGESNCGGDIVTLNEYSNFEFKVDFQLTEGANSGIKYFVTESMPQPKGSAIGLEFQILDDAKHPDAEKGNNGNRKVGSLYDLIPAPANKKVMPMGEFNTAHIIVKGNEVEHKLNGVTAVKYNRASDEFKAKVADSKYKDIAGFGSWPKGRILLQDHGDLVYFKNIKVRPLK